MDPIMWDLQLTQSGGTLSSFQRETLGALYSTGRRPGRPDIWSSRGEHQAHQTAARRARHAAANQPVREWPGLVLVSLLTLVPMAMSLYMAFGPM